MNTAETVQSTFVGDCSLNTQMYQASLQSNHRMNYIINSH